MLETLFFTLKLLQLAEEKIFYSKISQKLLENVKKHTFSV